MTCSPATRAALVTGLAVVLASAASACGKEDGGTSKPPPGPAPTAPDRRPGLPEPVAPPAPRMFPTLVTIDELTAHQPVLDGARITTPLTVDPAGKQATTKACLTAAEPKVGMHRVADAFGVARWNIKNRTSTHGDRRAELAGEHVVADGTLGVRGVVAASADCGAGELGLTLLYSKLVDARRPSPPTPASPATAPSGGRRLAPP